MSNVPSANDGDMVQQLMRAMREEIAPLRAQVASLEQRQTAQNAATPGGLARVVRSAAAAARVPSSDPPPVRRLSWLFGEGQAAPAAAPSAALPATGVTHPPPPQPDVEQQPPRRQQQRQQQQSSSVGILRRRHAAVEDESDEDPADEDYADALEGQLASHLPADPSLADYFGGGDLPVPHTDVRWSRSKLFRPVSCHYDPRKVGDDLNGATMTQLEALAVTQEANGLPQWASTYKHEVCSLVPAISYVADLSAHLHGLAEKVVLAIRAHESLPSSLDELPQALVDAAVQTETIYQHLGERLGVVRKVSEAAVADLEIFSRIYGREAQVVGARSTLEAGVDARVLEGETRRLIAASASERKSAARGAAGLAPQPPPPPPSRQSFRASASAARARKRPGSGAAQPAPRTARPPLRRPPAAAPGRGAILPSSP